MSKDIFEVCMPLLGVNDEFVILNQWNIKAGQKVQKGDLIAELETSKASFELEAGQTGFCFPIVQEGAKVSVQKPVALIFSREDKKFIDQAINKYKKQENINVEPEKKDILKQPRLTKKARLLAEKHKLDLASLPTNRIVRESDLVNMIIPPKTSTNNGAMKKIAIYGASHGGCVVYECLKLMAEYEVSIFLDDDPALIGSTYSGLPVVHGKGLQELHEKGIYGIASHIPNRDFRMKLLKQTESARLVPINVIHPQAFVSPSVILGKGNLIKAGSVIDADVVIGSGCIVDNGVIIPHHNVIGDCCHLAPGVIFGGECRIGKKTLIGIGAKVTPHLKIGENVIVTPGSCVTHDIPDNVVVSGSPAKIIGKRN